MPQFTLAIPTYNRYDYLIKDLQRYIDSSDITEIIICDDGKSDVEKLYKLFKAPKLKMYINDKNLGASKNKIHVVSLASQDWVLLLDSDNSINNDTLKFLNNYEVKDSNLVIAPSFAKPAFDYTTIKDELTFKNWKKMPHLEEMFWNTGNYLVPKSLYNKAGKIVIDSEINPGPYDVIYINYFMCKELGCTFKLLPNFQYDHCISSNGIWITSHTQYDNWYKMFKLNAEIEANKC
jgi:glycosyltransferase involved in cell wall biosynthesis